MRPARQLFRLTDSANHQRYATPKGGPADRREGPRGTEHGRPEREMRGPPRVTLPKSREEQAPGSISDSSCYRNEGGREANLEDWPEPGAEESFSLVQVQGEDSQMAQPLSPLSRLAAAAASASRAWASWRKQWG